MSISNTSDVCGRVGRSLIYKVTSRYKVHCSEIPMARQGHPEVGECEADKYATTKSAAQAEQSSKPRPSNLLQLLQLQPGRQELSGKSGILQLQTPPGKGKKFQTKNIEKFSPVNRLKRSDKFFCEQRDDNLADNIFDDSINISGQSCPL